MSDDPFEEFAQRLDGLCQAPERVAAAAAHPLLETAKSQWAAGQGPSGEEWAPLKGRSGVPLARPTSEVLARAERASIVLTLDDVLQYHQTGTEHFPRRQVVPDAGESLPSAWEEVVNRAAEDVLSEAAG